MARKPLAPVIDLAEFKRSQEPVSEPLHAPLDWTSVRVRGGKNQMVLVVTDDYVLELTPDSSEKLEKALRAARRKLLLAEKYPSEG